MKIDYFFRRKVLHLFFPNRCPLCNEIIGANDCFCIECENKPDIFSGTFSIPESSGFLAVYEYNKKISPVIFLLKNGICGNADFALGTALAQKIEENCIRQNIDIIVPIPLHRSSMKKRGFNQSELIGKVISRRLNIPLSGKAIKKIRKTAAQKSIKKYAYRRINIKSAFQIAKPELIQGKRILLIDDVCTTGSTLSEITSLLKKNGAAEVYCASCCKTVLKHRQNT